MRSQGEAEGLEGVCLSSERERCVVEASEVKERGFLGLVGAFQILGLESV